MGTNSGRRPGPDRTVGGAMSVSGHSAKVQQKADDITMKVLDALEGRLDELLKKGAFDAKSLEEVMDEFRKTVRATKRPPTTINLLQTGETRPALPPARAEAIDNAAQSPEARQALRDSHRRAIERKDGT